LKEDIDINDIIKEKIDWLIKVKNNFTKYIYCNIKYAYIL
jgi:hypothetical protein